MALTSPREGVCAAVVSAADPRALLRHARLLVVTPHPDDESLATGGLLQLAMRLGAKVRILQVTDGDNNPWPQRVLERRVLIDARARHRWAERRRQEVATAIDTLGLPAEAFESMNWPDMGVTARLRQQGLVAVDTLAARIAAWQPTVVVMPALGDTHPDHGSSHVLTRLALARLQNPAVCLDYLIHGKPCSDAKPVVFDLDAGIEACKRNAVLAHRSQVALSRKRLLAKVGCHEQFQLQAPDCVNPLPDVLPLPWRIPFMSSRLMHLTLAHAAGVHDWPLHRAPLTHGRRGQCSLQLPPDVPRQAPLFARLDIRMSSPWIFDLWGWRRLTAVAGMPQA